MPYQGRLPYTYKSPFNTTLDQGTQTVPSLAFLGDTNNGLFSPATDNVAITTNGSEKLRVTDVGNVGIGITNPDKKFIVYGSGGNFVSEFYNTNDAVNNNGVYIRTLNANSATYPLSVNSGTNGSNQLFLIRGDGNIGIGTTNPTSKLHVYNGDLELSGGYNLTWGGTFSGGNPTIWGNASNKTIRFAPDGNTTGLVALLGASSSYILGNIGIGTTNPQKKVHIYSSSPIRFEDQNRQWDTNIKDGKLVIGDNTASADRLAIDTSGNVGIGFTSPTTRLDVDGRIRGERYVGINSLTLNSYQTVNPASNVFLYSQGDDRDSWIYLDSADTGSNWGIYHRQINSTVSGLPGNSIGFIGGGSNILQSYISLQTGDAYVRGNVGIGISTPSYSLHVRTSSSAAVAVLESTQSGGDNVQLRFKGTNGEKWAIGNNVTTGGTGTNFDIFDLTAVTGRFRINASGNIGIGTADPQDTLHVYGSNSDIVISNSSTGSAGLLIRYLNGTQHGTNLLYNPGSAITYLDNTYPVVAGTVYGDMYFRQNVGGTMTNRIVIKGATGRIGIGTDTPSLKFHVYDSNTVARFESSSSYVDLQLSNSVSSVGFIQYNGGDLRFFANSGSTPSITIKGGSPGNVGIGTTNPSAPLHIQGNTYITGALTAESYGYARIFNYDAPASPDGTGYVWIRASMGGFNGGGDVVKFSLGRAIWENNSNPYGGPLLDVTGAYSREWHGGQEFFTATYGAHGSVPGSGWVLNAGPRDQAGGGAWFYLRVWAGVRYIFRYPMSSGYISPTWEQTTDPGFVPLLRYGVNILGNNTAHLNVGFDIIAGGVVGIGTTSPVKSLDVRGEATFGAGITTSDLAWGKDTNQLVYTFSGVASGVNPADGCLALVTPNTNPSATRIGSLVFGNKVSGPATTANPGLKAAIECGTNTNVTNAADTGAILNFLTKPDNANFRSQMTLNSNGVLTKPYQPAFLAFRNTALSHPSGWQLISNDILTESYDVGPVYSTSTNGRFVAPVTGKYMFYAGGYSSSSTSGERYAFGVKINNSGSPDFIAGGNYSLLDSPLAAYQVVLHLNANDYVELYFFSAVATTLGTGSHPIYWGGYLLG